MKKTSFNFTKAGFYVSGCILLFLASFSMAEMDNDVPTGVAALPSGTFKEEWSTNKVEGCIGGGNGEVVTARSGGELSGYLKGDTPMYIQVEGSISGNFDIGSNKTIIGMGEGATISGMFALGRVSNIIMRNLKITKGTDAIGVYGPHNLWIDHCDVSACADGLIDIKSGSDQVTVSWTRLSNHHKTMLINSGSLKPGDAGRLHVTLHHLFFDGTRSRNPRAGVGQVHILNCYYVGVGYGLHTYCEVEVTVEGCYFKNTNDAISQHKPGFSGTKHKAFNMNWDGHVKMIDNVFDNAQYKMKDETDPDRIFQIDNYYMYDWMKDAAKDVPEIVGNGGAGTGSKWSKLGPLPIPGQGVVNVSRTPTLKWTKVGSQASNKVYFGKTKNPPEVATVDGYSYKPGNLDEGTVYYWKINDGKLWTFRTSGKLAPTSLKPAVSAKKISVKTPKLQKRIYNNKSGFFVGVEKIENNKTQLYDIRGREHVNKNSHTAKIKK